MIHSIQCSQNPANNSREDANAEAKVIIFNIGKIDITKYWVYIHLGIETADAENRGLLFTVQWKFKSPDISSHLWLLVGDARSTNMHAFYYRGSPL